MFSRIRSLGSVNQLNTAWPVLHACIPYEKHFNKLLYGLAGLLDLRLPLSQVLMSSEQVKLHLVAHATRSTPAFKLSTNIVGVSGKAETTAALECTPRKLGPYLNYVVGFGQHGFQPLTPRLIGT